MKNINIWWLLLTVTLFGIGSVWMIAGNENKAYHIYIMGFICLVLARQ